MPTSRTPWTVALLAAGLLALLGIVGATFWLSWRAQIYSEGVVAVRELRVSAVELRNGLLNAESSQRGYLFSANEIYLAPFGNAKATALREIGELDGDLKRYPQLEPMVSQLSRLVGAKIAEMEETIALKRMQRDEEALDLFLTNRGKALMDQTNIFVAGIIEAADTLLLEGVREQTANAQLLRWVSLAGAFVVMLVVAGTVSAFTKTAREIADARDEVRGINETLEGRVEERTSALQAALSRSEMLLAEVNHRVANSLAMVGSLVRLQGAASKDDSVKLALTETQSRIEAIAAVHKRLYASGDVGLVALDEYLSGVLDSLATAMKAEGRGGSLTYELDPATLDTDASVNVGLVVTELVTNAYKYAYPEGAGGIRVRLKRMPSSRVEIVVEDDGVGRGTGAARGTGLGTRIVKAMAATLGTEVQYVDRKPGTAAMLSVSVAQS
ncbi:MAG: sensor histidine kinase [Rhizobiaceae bacterium]